MPQQLTDSSSLQKFLNQNNNTAVFTTLTNYSLWNWDPIPIIPYGLVYKFASEKDMIMSEDEYLQQQESLLHELSGNLPPTEKYDHLLLIAGIPKVYAAAYVNTGLYLIERYQNYETARRYFTRAIDIYPDATAAYTGLAIYYFHHDDCQKTQENIAILNRYSISDPEVKAYVEGISEFLNAVEKKCSRGRSSGH
jgi:tetratricopeptide (TPR) repeat protein